MKRNLSILILGVALFACSGEDGTNGTNGTDGTDGTDGKSYLTKVTDEASGENCLNGGIKVDIGIDTNEDATLGDDEILTTSYVCDGEDSDAVLIKITDEPDGENCPDGGSKIEVGIDENGNNILDIAEVETTSYICKDISNGGKTTIILEGDITDAEAAAKIASELGVNTQNVTISNTTQLTSVDLSLIKDLIELDIRGNSALTSIDLTGLTTAGGISINSNSLLTSIDLSGLTTAGAISINSNSLLTSIDLTGLTTASGGIFINLSDNKFTSEIVNQILAQLVSIMPVISSSSILLRQVQPAPPTGQGITDKATLEGNGNTVDTDNIPS